MARNPQTGRNAGGGRANQRESLESLGKEVRQRNFDGQHPVMPVRVAASSGHALRGVRPGDVRDVYRKKYPGASLQVRC